MGKSTISVFGLGYIGLPLTAAFAKVGYKVIGVDIDEKKIKSLSDTYCAQIFEPGLNETLQACRNSIKFTTDAKFAIQNSGVLVITVGTPLKDAHTPNFEFIEAIIRTIGKSLFKGQLVILKSTVLIGTTENFVKKNLEEISGLRAGKDFFLAFCPERTIEGLALHELYTLPKIVGGINKESTDAAAKVLQKLGGQIVKVSSPKIAELCKLVDNLYRAINISFANEIGMVCEAAGIDAAEVVLAVNTSYKRTSIFNPGLGADGPCLSKDPQIFSYFARQNNFETFLADAAIKENEKSTLRIADVVKNFVTEKKLKNPKIAFVGLAFKGFPETDDQRGSPAIKIHSKLKGEIGQFEVASFDPIVKKFEGKKTCESISECVRGANVVLFLTNHPLLSNLDPKIIINHASKPLLLVDCWHNLKNPKTLLPKESNVSIFRVGDGSK